MNVSEIINLCVAAGACADGLAKFRAWAVDRETLDLSDPTLWEDARSHVDVAFAAQIGVMPREVALSDPKWAYRYAHYVDRGPRDDTRAATLSDPEWAYLYAVDVDKGPREDTRAQ